MQNHQAELSDRHLLRVKLCDDHRGLARLIIGKDEHRGLAKAPVDSDAPCHLGLVFKVVYDVTLETKLLIYEAARWLRPIKDHRLALIRWQQLGSLEPFITKI